MSRLISFLVGQAWAMHEPVLGQMVELLGRHASGVRLDQSEIEAVVPNAFIEVAEPDAARQLYTRNDTVAVIPVGGVISKYASGVPRVSRGRGTSVEEIRQAMDQAESDSKVRSFLLKVDSPGGSVMGLSSLADHIAGVRKRGIPVVTQVDGMAASGAYWIASQSDRIVANRTSVVGSIGVYAVLQDTSKLHEQLGVRPVLVKAGKHKGIGADGVPVDAESISVVQAEIDSYYEAFVSDVSRGRKGAMTRAQVLAVADGRVYFDKEALESGLIDQVATVEETIAWMNKEFGRTERRPVKSRQSEGVTVMPNGSVGESNAVDAAVTSVVQQSAGGPISLDDIRRVAAEAATQATVELSARQLARSQEINAACAGFESVASVQQLRAEALADPGMSVDAFRAKLLDAVRAGSPPTGIVATGGGSGQDRMRADLQLQMLTRVMPSVESRLARGGPQAETLAEGLGCDSAADFRQRLRVVRSAGMAGHTMLDIARALTPRGSGMGREDLVRAATSHATSDFPSLLSGLTNKILLASFTEESVTYDRWCRIGSASDFKPQTMITVSELSSLTEIVDNKTPEEGTLGDRAESIKLRTFGKRWSLTRQMLINDDLQAFASIPQMIGAAAARVPEDLAYIALNTAQAKVMADGVTFFNASRGNLLTAAALGVGAIENAVESMMLQRGFGPDKAELQVEGKYLLVPTGLRFVAQRIVSSTVRSNAGESAPGNASSEPNTVAFLEPIPSNRLHRASATAWYIVADPAIMPAVQVNFLNGQRAPIVSEVGDGSILKLTYEAIFDCGAALVQPEGAVKNPGA